MKKNKLSTTHSVCLGLNIQGMNPSLRSNSFWKLNQLTSEIEKIQKKNFNIPFIAVVESWIKPHISDAQVAISGYNIFRADREHYKNGGALLYIHTSIIIDNYDFFDNDICSAIICFSKKSKCFIACVYRPPSSDKANFLQLLNFISNFIDIHYITFHD